MTFPKKIKNSTFFKYFLYVSIPAILMIVFMILNIAYSASNYEKILKGNYSSYLSNLYTQSETALQSIAGPISALDGNSVFMSVATGKTSEPEAIEYVRSKLSELEKNNSIIDSIFVLNRSENKKVITKNGVYDMRSFFGGKYVYKNYDFNHWNNYRSSSEKRYFSPTEVYSAANSEKMLILPLAFSKINKTYMSNLVIVNINLSKLLDSVQTEEMSQSAVMGVVNRYTKTFYTNAEDFDGKFDNDFFNMLYTKKNITFNYTLSGKKCFVAAYSPRNSILGYTYVAITPYGKIIESMMPTVYISVALFVVAILLLSLMAYLSTKRIYTPLEKLAAIIPGEEEPNLIDRLHNSITELLESSNGPESEIQKSTLPYSQEHLLVNLLNSEENSSVPHLDEVRSKNLLNFEHDYFCSVVVTLHFSDEFYVSYNTVDYNALIGNLYNIIQLCFSEKFNTFILPSKTNTLYLLLNLPDKSSDGEINSAIEYIKGLLEYDNAYINTDFSVGGIRKDLSGLKESHHNALRSLNLSDTYSGVDLENTASPSVPTYIFTVSDEETLLNLLLTEKTVKASELIDKITNDNITGNVPDSAVMQMYAQIIGVIFKVMRTKRIEYDPEKLGDYTLISKAVSFSMINARKAIDSYLDMLAAQETGTTSKVDINAVIEYIGKNYRSELFLDKLAEVFGTTPKYLSKLIKSHLGITFLAYLTNLRISKAKELLSDSDKNITEIYGEVGFNNRNSFTATFKKIVGVTPSEYRRLSREKNSAE